MGHVCATRSHVDGTPALALGPIGVSADHQGRGIGSALVIEKVRVSASIGKRLTALLESPSYYHRFGFESSIVHGIVPPNPGLGDRLRIKLLSRAQGSIKRTFHYAPLFGIPAT